MFVFKTYWPGSSFQPKREREQTIPWSLYLDSSLFVFRTEIRGPGGRSNRIGRGSNQEQSAINRAPKKKQHGGERVRLPGVKARERERERERERVAQWWKGTKKKSEYSKKERTRWSVEGCVRRIRPDHSLDPGAPRRVTLHVFYWSTLTRGATNLFDGIVKIQ